MNSNQKNFAELQEKFTKIIYDNYDKEITKISKENNSDKRMLLRQIADVLLKYTIKDDSLSISNKDRLQLRKELYELVDSIFKMQITAEQELCDTVLNDVALDKIYSNSYLYSLGVNYNLKVVSEKTLKQILNKKIQGKNYSDRIWDNKNKVAKSVKSEINSFLNGKTTVNEINSGITQRFNQNWNNSNRLVTNEISRVQEEANLYWRKQHNIKQVLYSATLDKKTCTDCGKFDGNVYDNDKAPNIPKHVRCRCTLISLVDEKWRPSQRLDNETKKRIDWQSYEEWLEKQNINND